MSFPHFWGKRPLLKLIGVEAFYGKIKALHGVSLEVPDGKLVCILGANGAGKTTILKTISGVVEPEMGTIHFDGERIDRLDAEKIVSLGISHVPENRHIFPELTVYENLVMGGFLVSDRSLLETRLEEIFDRFAVLRERKDQLAGTLSGGEQQMLTIARTLMGNPKLILLDEPSEGLAPVIVQQMAATIQELKRMGLTVLLSEQNLRFATKLAERAYIIEKGHIRYEGTMQELAENEDVRNAYLTV